MQSWIHRLNCNLVTIEKLPWNCWVFKDLKSSGGCDDSSKTFKKYLISSCLRKFSEKISFFCLKFIWIWTVWKKISECLQKFFEQVSPLVSHQWITNEMNRIRSLLSARQWNRRSYSLARIWWYLNWTEFLWIHANFYSKYHHIPVQLYSSFQIF